MGYADSKDGKHAMCIWTRRGFVAPIVGDVVLWHPAQGKG